MMLLIVGPWERLVKALLNDKAKLTKVIAENGDWYQQTLSEVKQSKVRREKCNLNISIIFGAKL